MKTIVIVVKGKVQGVYFRQSTKEKAATLEIKGTVSNEPDGSVRIVATGNEEQLQQLVQWCHYGPSSARVASVQVSESPYEAFPDFSIVRKS
jgi:acylphosphatase